MTDQSIKQNGAPSGGSLPPDSKLAITKVKAVMLSPEIQERFKKLTANPNHYVESVILAVANSPDLQRCTPASIVTSALRSASLGLSVDAALGHAHLVPYKDLCVFQIGYRGLTSLATQTGKYRYINVGPVFRGQVVEEDQLTGFHKIHGLPEGRDAWLVGASDEAIIGIIGAFEMYKGFSKSIYMTREELEAHGARYSPSYNHPKSLWKKPIERVKMWKKTALKRLLLGWGVFDTGVKEMIQEVDENPNSLAINANFKDDPDPVPATDKPPETEEQIMKSLGFSPDPPKTAPVVQQEARTATNTAQATQSSSVSAPSLLVLPVEPEPFNPMFPEGVRPQDYDWAVFFQAEGKSIDSLPIEKLAELVITYDAAVGRAKNENDKQRLVDYLEGLRIVLAVKRHRQQHKPDGKE